MYNNDEYLNTKNCDVETVDEYVKNKKKSPVFNLAKFLEEQVALAYYACFVCGYSAIRDRYISDDVSTPSDMMNSLIDMIGENKKEFRNEVARDVSTVNPFKSLKQAKFYGYQTVDRIRDAIGTFLSDKGKNGLSKFKNGDEIEKLLNEMKYGLGDALKNMMYGFYQKKESFDDVEMSTPMDFRKYIKRAGSKENSYTESIKYVGKKLYKEIDDKEKERKASRNAKKYIDIWNDKTDNGLIYVPNDLYADYADYNPDYSWDWHEPRKEYSKFSRDDRVKKYAKDYKIPDNLLNLMK